MGLRLTPQKFAGDLFPFGGEVGGLGWAVGAAVPVVGVEGVALGAVEVGVDPGGFAGVVGLGDFVGLVPVVMAGVPQG